jgi:hypothetical protein
MIDVDLTHSIYIDLPEIIGTNSCGCHHPTILKNPMTGPLDGVSTSGLA